MRSQEQPRRQSARLAGEPPTENPETPIRIEPSNTIKPPSANTSAHRLSETAEQRNQRIKWSLAEKEGQSQTEKEKEKPREGTPEQENQEELMMHPDDPDPPQVGASEAQVLAYKKAVQSYTREMLEAYMETSLTGESLWTDFRTAFRPQSINLWTRPMMTIWADFLTNRGVYINQCGNKTRANALVQLLYRTDHIQARRADQLLTLAREEMRVEKMSKQAENIDNQSVVNHPTWVSTEKSDARQEATGKEKQH